MSDREKKHIAAQVAASQVDRIVDDFPTLKNNSRDEQGRIVIPYVFEGKEGKPPIDRGTFSGNFRMPTPERQRLIESVLQEYEAVANLVFKREEAGQKGVMRFTTNPEHIGGMGFPDPHNHGALVIIEEESFNASPAYMRELIRHEIGHALGLNHSNDPLHPRAKMPARPEVEGYPNTVMNQNSTRDGLSMDSLGVADILAMQKIYGAPKAGSASAVTVALPAPESNVRVQYVASGVNAMLDVSAARPSKIDLRTGIDFPTLLDGDKKLVLTPGSHVGQVIGPPDQSVSYHSSFKGHVAIKGGDQKDHYHLWGPDVRIDDPSENAQTTSHIHIHKGAGGVLNVHNMDALALHFPEGKKVQFVQDRKNPAHVTLLVQQGGGETSKIEINTKIAPSREAVAALEKRHNAGLAKQPALSDKMAEQDIECPQTPDKKSEKSCSR